MVVTFSLGLLIEATRSGETMLFPASILVSGFIASLIADLAPDSVRRKQSPADTLRFAVGSNQIVGTSLPVHGSRLERYSLDAGKDSKHTGWIVNVMTIGDSAG